MASNMSDDSSDDGSDMSVNSARSNPHPFETLSDDPILHILSFLPGGDLLTLAGMDKKFNRIVKTTQETMAKIRLVVDPGKSVEFDEVIRFAQAHHVTALKLVGLRLNNVSFELFELLYVLSNTVEDLVIEKCCFTNQYQFRMIIQKFLGKMTKCGIYNARIQYDDNVIPWKSSIDYPLKALIIEYEKEYKDYDYPNTEFLKFFEGCTQLQSFKTDIPRNHVEPSDQEKDQDHLPKFLVRQTHLKKLTFDPSDYDLHLMSFPQLEELTLSDTKLEFIDTDRQESAIQVSIFLTKLPNLKTLYLRSPELSPLIMEAVCNAPKLEDLRIQATSIDEFDDEGDYPDNEGRFQNQTVKKLRIEDELGFVHWLLPMFLGVNSVILDVPEKPKLKLGDVPYDVLEKIEFEDASSRLNVQFAPFELPINMGSFESALLSFASKHAERIVGIKIGHEWWYENDEVTPEDFSLSTSFCERLIKCLPMLEKLELYNVADFHGVESFLVVYKKNFPKLKYTMLYSTDPELDGDSSINTDDPEPEKMEVD